MRGSMRMSAPQFRTALKDYSCAHMVHNLQL